MIFDVTCWPRASWFPCDIAASMEPQVGIAGVFAMTVLGLAYVAVLFVLATRGKG